MPTTQPFDASSYIETALTTQTPTNFFPKDTIPQRSRDSTQCCCGWPPTRHLVKHFPRLSRNLWNPDGLVAIIVAGDLRAMLVTNGYSKYPDHDQSVPSRTQQGSLSPGAAAQPARPHSNILTLAHRCHCAPVQWRGREAFGPKENLQFQRGRRTAPWISPDPVPP